MLTVDVTQQYSKDYGKYAGYEVLQSLWAALGFTFRSRVNFQSELVRQVCCLLEINQTKTTSYRPGSNGMVERFNQTLVNMITTYVNEEQDNWDTFLPIATSAYRSSVHECTSFTPNQLFFGREHNLPIHFLVGSPAQARQEFSSYTDYVVNLN